MRDLEHIFPLNSVGRMTENEIYSIATEPEGLKREITFYRDNLSRLEDGYRLVRNAIGNSDGTKEAMLTKLLNDVSSR